MCRASLVVFVVLMGLTSCNNSGKRGAPVAKVNGEYLYEKDLADVIPRGLKKEDSTFFRQNFITTWIKEELMFSEAESTLGKKEKNKEKELHDYYRSLLRQEYLKSQLNKKLDRNVTEQEIEAYYTENRKNFELKRNIIRFVYLKTRIDAPNRSAAKEWIRTLDKKGMENLKDYAAKYALNYNLDTTSWFFFDDIMKEIPLKESYEPESFIKNNSYVELRDQSYLYIMNVIDNRIKDGISPLDLVRPKIKNIILNIRKVTAIQKLEDTIYRKAAAGKQFEVYTQ